MIFGFTGTQRGMRPLQRTSLAIVMRQLAEGNDEFHFGDCVGGDAEAFDLAESFAFFTVAHPPIDPKKRAWKRASIVLEPKTYLERNKDIVDEADVLLAAPFEFIELQRSGTWSTLRYAQRKRVKRYIVWPDGKVTERT